MITGRFRRLLPAIASCLVMAFIAASIPAVSHADGGEGRDSHERTKDPGKQNPRQPPPSPFNEKRL
jgi:hypothetical protein